MRPSLTTAVFLATVVTLSLSGQSSDRVSTDTGDIVLTPIIHASIQIEHAGRVIQVDPWSAGDLSRAKPADLILVTDDPAHHLDPTAIATLRKPGAPVVVTSGGHARFPAGRVLSNGESGVFAGIRVEAIPAYDLTPGNPLHPKGEANGYVVTLGSRRVYIAGVTECVPENPGAPRYRRRDPTHEFTSRSDASDTGSRMCQDVQAEIVYLYHYDLAYARWLGDPQGPQPNTAQETAATLRVFQDALEGEPVEFRNARWYP